MAPIKWLCFHTVLDLHEEALGEHGGLPGVRDRNLVRSALDRARNLHAYEGVTDLAELTGTIVWGLARNHPFNDANKRTSLSVAEAFLKQNGVGLDCRIKDIIDLAVSIARGDTDREGTARWVRKRMTPLRGERDRPKPVGGAGPGRRTPRPGN